MVARRYASMLIVSIAVAVGLSSCDRLKNMVGMGGDADFRNAQIDVAGTSCSDNDKLSSLMLQGGHYQLAGFEFSLQGEVKRGDVFGHTQPGTPAASVFLGTCSDAGQTSQTLFVYGADENGKPKRLAAVDLSDDAGGAANGFTLEDGTIVVAQSQAKTTYALLNGKMTNLTTGAVDDEGGAAGTDTVSFEVFHEKLQPYGQWLQHKRWGTVWHPSEPDFKPYQNGHWEDSDEYGTLWVSDEPFGDLPTHYGRWGYDPAYGWLWVPGYVWGPSWVIWRAGDDYVGWFPMPPGAYDGEGDYVDDWNDWYGYRQTLGDEAVFFGLWSFVPHDDIYNVNIRTRIVDRRSYGRFITRSRAWTHYGIAHGHVVSRGLDKARFRDTFHRAMPGSRHDFKGSHITSVKAGHRIATRERNGGGHARQGFAHNNNTPGQHGGMRNGAGGFQHNGGSGGNARNGQGFARQDHGFQHNAGPGGSGRNTRNEQGFSRQNRGLERSANPGGNARGSGFSRSGHGSFGNGSERGIARSGGGSQNGFARSSGGFANSGSYRNGGGNSYSRSSGGAGFGGGTRPNGVGGSQSRFGGFNHSGGGSGGGGGGVNGFGGSGVPGFGNSNRGGGGFGNANRGGGGGFGGGGNGGGNSRTVQRPPKENNNGNHHH